MKLTNADIYNAKLPMQKLLGVKLPVVSGLAVVRLSRTLGGPLGDIEKVRDNLISTYGEQDPNRPGGSKISPEMEGFPKFAEEFGELLGQEVEVETEQVTIPAGVEIEPFVLMALEKFILVE